MPKRRVPFGRKARHQEEAGKFSSGTRNPEGNDERRERLKRIRENAKK